MARVSPDRRKWLQELPKVELHLHLEGSATPEFLASLGAPPSLTEAAESGTWRALFDFADFSEFLAAYRLICRVLRGPEEYLGLFRLVAEYLVHENIQYAEITMAPAIPRRFGYNAEEIVDALLGAAAEFQAKHGIQVRWIFDNVRQFGPEEAQWVAELAFAHRHRGVVAIGLGGDELARSAREFEAVYAWARSHELFAHVHAGEIGEPRSIWEAVEILGANRIGHGIHAARDPKLMEYLRSHTIGLDICLTSNLRTRAWPILRNHPLRLLMERGVPVSLHTDDPGLFATTLSQEYEKAISHLGCCEEDVVRLLLQAARSSFLSHRSKMEFLEEYTARLYTQAAG
ncbi:MAG: hypothetical protein Kow00109_16160 [Acidobacteriota bacterium]